MKNDTQQNDKLKKERTPHQNWDLDLLEKSLQPPVWGRNVLGRLKQELSTRVSEVSGQGHVARTGQLGASHWVLGDKLRQAAAAGASTQETSPAHSAGSSRPRNQPLGARLTENLLVGTPQKPKGTQLSIPHLCHWLPQ